MLVSGICWFDIDYCGNGVVGLGLVDWGDCGGGVDVVDVDLVVCVFERGVCGSGCLFCFC